MVAYRDVHLLTWFIIRYVLAFTVYNKQHINLKHSFNGERQRKLT